MQADLRNWKFNYHNLMLTFFQNVGDILV